MGKGNVVGWLDLVFPVCLLHILMGLVVVFASGCADSEEFVFGAMLTLKVEQAVSPDGEDVRDGMLLALQELNSSGGIQGKNVRLEIRDNESDPETAKIQFADLMENYAPVVTFSCYSHISMALSAMTKEQEVPLLAIVTSTDITRGKKWVFRYWPSVEDHVMALNAMILQSGLDRLSLLYVDTAFGRTLFELLQEHSQKAGVSIDGASIDIGEVDFHAALQPLLGSPGILIVGLGNHYIPAFTALDELGYTGVRLATSSAAMPDMMAMDAFDGAWVDAPQIHNPRLPYPEQIRQVYEDAYDKPFSYFSAIGYEAIMLAADLLRQGEPTRQGFVQAFEAGFVYPGLFGDVSPKTGSHDLSIPLYPARIEHGKLVYMER